MGLFAKVGIKSLLVTHTEAQTDRLCFGPCVYLSRFRRLSLLCVLLSRSWRLSFSCAGGEWSTASSTSSGEEDRRSKSLEAETKELRAKVEALEKEEAEGVQGGQGLPSRRESGLEEEWCAEMDFEDEAESRRNLDEQMKKLQSFRKALRVRCSSSCSKWSKGGMTSCQSTRKCRTDHKRYEAFSTKEEICKKKVLQHKRKCGRSEEIDRNEERFRQVPDKVDNNMVDAEMAAERQGL